MNLQAWRIKKKWSLRKMAAELSAVVGREEPCAASTILGWETGRFYPSLPYAAAIIQVTRGAVKLADLIAARPSS